MDYMNILFAVISILFFLFVCYRMIKMKRIPSNRYTSFDDLILGSNPDVKQESKIQDTKHETEYEEKTNINP